MMAHGRTLMEGKLKPEAEGGKDWKYFMKTIPPRSKKEKVMVRIVIITSLYTSSYRSNPYWSSGNLHFVMVVRHLSTMM